MQRNNKNSKHDTAGSKSTENDVMYWFLLLTFVVMGCANERRTPDPWEKNREHCERKAEENGYRKFTAKDFFLSSIGFDRGIDRSFVVSICMKGGEAKVDPQLHEREQIELSLPPTKDIELLWKERSKNGL